MLHDLISGLAIYGPRWTLNARRVLKVLNVVNRMSVRSVPILCIPGCTGGHSNLV